MDPKQLLLGLAAVLRDERSSNGWSQEKLAEQAGVHRNYVGTIERAEQAPTITTMTLISNALNLEVSELLALAEKRARSF